MLPLAIPEKISKFETSRFIKKHFILKFLLRILYQNHSKSLVYYKNYHFHSPSN